MSGKRVENKSQYSASLFYMFEMKVSFARVYHACYIARNSKSQSATLIHKIMSRKYRYRREWVKHLETIRVTQTLGPKLVPTKVLHIGLVCNRVLVLQKVRCIQRAALKYVWRPESNLVSSLLQSDMDLMESIHGNLGNSQ